MSSMVKSNGQEVVVQAIGEDHKTSSQGPEGTIQRYGVLSGPALDPL